MIDVSPRERRRKARLNQLLDDGLALLAEGGVDGLTLARLADRVDLTPAALYRYFSSKDALLAALLARVLEDLEAEIAALPQDLPPLQATLAALGLYVRLSEVQPLHFGLLAVTLADPRVLVADPEDAVHVPALGRLVARLATSLAAALPSTTPADAVALLLGLTGVLSVRKMQRMDPSLDANALADRLVLTHLVGLGASADAVQKATRAVRPLLKPAGDAS